MRLRLGLIPLAVLTVSALAWAQRIVPIEQDGRTIYVNEQDAPPALRLKAPEPAPAAEAATPQSGWVYWSSREHRFKPVPRVSSSAMRNARSALNDVERYLAGGSAYKLVR